jgi:hypothetical protein
MNNKSQTELITKSDEEFEEEKQLWIKQSWKFFSVSEEDCLWEDLEILKWKNPWIKSWELPKEEEMNEEIDETPHWPGKLTWDLPLGYQLTEDEAWDYDSDCGCNFFIGDVEEDFSEDFIIEKIICPWMDDVWGYSCLSPKLVEIFERLDSLLDIPMDKWPPQVLARGYGRRKKALQLLKSQYLGEFNPSDSMQLLLSISAWDPDGILKKEIKRLEESQIKKNINVNV